MKLRALKVTGVPTDGISGVTGQKAIWMWPRGEAQSIL
jgi:hypothetical protein